MRKSFCVDFKAVFKRPAVYVLFAVIIAIMIWTITDTFIKKDTLQSDFYGISEYGSMEELDIQIGETTALIDSEKARLEELILYESAPSEIRGAEQNIRYLNVKLSIMAKLRDQGILYGNAARYGTLDADNAAAVLTTIVMFMAIAVAVFTSVSIATGLPSERRGGQYKITFLFPQGKLKYSAMKAAIKGAEGLIFLIAAQIIAAICVAAVFPVKDRLLVFADTSSVFMLNYFYSALYAFGLSVLGYLFCCIAAYGVSVLTKNEIFAFILVLILCFSGYICDLLDKIITADIAIFRWLLPSNIFPAAAYSDILIMRSAGISVCVCLLDLALLLGCGLIKFAKTRN